MPASTDGDNDEFDSLFDDQFLDPELEQSLAQVEASYTASQVPSAFSQAPPSQRQASRFARSISAASALPRQWNPAPASSNRRGTFVPPLKKQRIDNSTQANVVASRLRHQPFSVEPARSLRRQPAPDEVIVQNLKADEFGDDDLWWSGAKDLDQVEEEAIRMSQRTLSQQPSQAETPSHAPVAPNARSVTPANPNGEALADVDQLRREIQELQRAAKQQEELIRKLRTETQAREGEVKVVRSNLSKINLENAALRESVIKKDLEHKREIEQLNAQNQRQMETLETTTAFRRAEQDTSRRHWPSSVRRLPPATVRERPDTQSAVGLTTPTKRGGRYGRVSLTPSPSKASPRGSRRHADPFDQPEPTSPSRRDSDTSRSKPKPPAFPGFQNSFSTNVLPSKLQQAQKKHVSRSPEVTFRSLAGRGRPVTDSQSQDFESNDVTMDDGDMLPPASLVEPATPCKSTEADNLDAVAYRRKQRYLWAVGELMRRRAAFVGQVLCHTCCPPSPPAYLPQSRYNSSVTTKDESAEHENIRHASTLHRLINVRFPDSVNQRLALRYARTTQYLLHVLTQGSVSDGDERLAFLLEQDEGWEEALDDGLLDLCEGAAAALQTLMGIFVRLCMTDRLRDTFKLASSLSSSYPRLADSLMSPQDAVWSYKSYERDDGPDDYDTPRSLTSILTESIKKLNVVKIAISSPLSAFVGDTDMEATEDRLMRGPATHTSSKETKTLTGENGDQSWDMGGDARHELVDSILDMLEILSWAFKGPHALESSLRFIGETDGLLHTLLDHKLLGDEPDALHKSADMIARTVRVMAFMTWNPAMTHVCLAARPSEPLGQAALSLSRHTVKLPVLDVLSKHLVDRRQDLPEEQWHQLHRRILILLTQAAIQSRDTRAILADCTPLLAALIRCLYLDTDSFWNEGQPANVGQLVERLCGDTRLLGVLYQSHNTMLSRKLEQQEANSMLVGIRQTFIVAMNRLAFASEPEWHGPQPQLEAIADLAANLVDMVLSPDETDAIFDLLADEGEDTSESQNRDRYEEVDEDEAAVAAEAHPPPSSGSETETEDEREAAARAAVIEVSDSENE